MASAMGFVFLQLRPIPYTDFMTYLLVMACSLGFAVCCLLLSSYGHRREDDYALARKGIALLQEQMDAYLKQKTDQQRKEELVNIQRLLYKQAYPVSYTHLDVYKRQAQSVPCETGYAGVCVTIL